jgi:hypothetical protein
MKNGELDAMRDAALSKFSALWAYFTGMLGAAGLAGLLQTWLSVLATGAGLVLTLVLLWINGRRGRQIDLECQKLQLEIEELRRNGP